MSSSSSISLLNFSGNKLYISKHQHYFISTMDAKSKTMPPRTYVDFNPILEWIRGEELDVALIHLPGFKKEQLRVEINNHGNVNVSVSVSGERPLNTDGKQWQRFSTNFAISANCDINNVHAKFDNNVLHISFPKLIAAIIEAAPPKLTTTDKHSATAAGVYATDKEKKADETNSQKKKELPAPMESLKPSQGFFESFKLSDGRSKGMQQGVDGLVMELTQARKKLLMNVAVATLVLFGLGFYFKYKFTKAETR